MRRQVSLVFFVLASITLTPVYLNAQEEAVQPPTTGTRTQVYPGTQQRTVQPPTTGTRTQVYPDIQRRAVQSPTTSTRRSYLPTFKKDDDRDGIDDKFEDAIARKYAPLVRLAPSKEDWTRPANVDWYLAQVQLRFENTGACNKDDLILKVGEVNQGNLSRQSRRDKKMTLGGCKNEGDRYYSNQSSRFFLQPPNDKVHSGAPAAQWTTYVHVSPSRVVSGGYDIQYWFFYAYNDSFGSFNHEADWERITVTVDRNGEFVEADFGQHNYSTRYQRNQLSFVEGTHPVVYSADGSHASYPRAGSFGIQGAPTRDHTYNGGPEWKTWQRLVNLGEKNYPLNGQTFIQYGGRWGEIGETEHTSGPQSPSFQSAWNPPRTQDKGNQLPAYPTYPSGSRQVK